MDKKGHSVSWTEIPDDISIGTTYSTRDVYTSTESTIGSEEELTLHSPKKEISDNIEKENYEIIDLESFLKEVEGMNDDRWERTKDIVVICASCLEKYFLKTIYRSRNLTCPECDNKLFFIENGEEYKLMKERLIGKRTKRDEEK